MNEHRHVPTHKRRDVGGMTIGELVAIYYDILERVDEQANTNVLWESPTTPLEARLQLELRTLHAIAEEDVVMLAAVKRMLFAPRTTT